MGKRFRIRYGIGKSKYSVSFHDGEKKHRDNSDFFDLCIFSNKKALDKFVKDLLSNGYTEEGYKTMIPKMHVAIQCTDDRTGAKGSFGFRKGRNTLHGIRFYSLTPVFDREGN